MTLDAHNDPNMDFVLICYLWRWQHHSQVVDESWIEIKSHRIFTSKHWIIFLKVIESVIHYIILWHPLSFTIVKKDHCASHQIDVNVRTCVSRISKQTSAEQPSHTVAKVRVPTEEKQDPLISSKWTTTKNHPFFSRTPSAGSSFVGPTMHKIQEILENFDFNLSIWEGCNCIPRTNGHSFSDDWPSFSRCIILMPGLKNQLWKSWKKVGAH